MSVEEEGRYLAATREPLASIGAVLVVTGLRPEECYRLMWESITWCNGRNGTLLVTHGKTKAASRVIPKTGVRTVLEERWESARKPLEGWVWPAPRQSGHVEPSSLKKHRKTFVLPVCGSLSCRASGIPFILVWASLDAMLGRSRELLATARSQSLPGMYTLQKTQSSMPSKSWVGTTAGTVQWLN